MKSVKIYDKVGNITTYFDDVIQASIEPLKDINSVFEIESVNNLKKITNSDGLYCFYNSYNKTIISEVNEYGIGKIVMELDDVENEIIEKLIEKNEK